MSTIVVSYRRDDSRQITGRIVEHLDREWPDGVRYDIDSMLPGKDFRKHLREILADSDVLVAVIGENWFAKDENGISGVSKWVQYEIEFALDNDILIIPVLVDGAKMPSAELLPELLREFAYRHAAELDSGRDFRNHMRRIITAIKNSRSQGDVSADGPKPIIAVEKTAEPSPKSQPEIASPRPAVVRTPRHDPNGSQSRPASIRASQETQPRTPANPVGYRPPERHMPHKAADVSGWDYGRLIIGIVLSLILVIGSLVWWQLSTRQPTLRLAEQPSPHSPPMTQPSNVPAVAQRVVLYEESDDPKGKRFVGTALWRTEMRPAAPGRPAELVVRADIEVPERKMEVHLSFLRNTEQLMSASHTMEIMFEIPNDFPGGGVQNVPGLLMKETEQGRGVPLAGLAVRINTSFFVIGLSSTEVDMQKNLQLIKEQAWFDIPVVYNNNRRAILALEKGSPGEQAFSRAFAAWKQ